MSAQRKVREQLKIYDMQHGLARGTNLTNAIFIVTQVEEKLMGKDMRFCNAFIDLETAFNRVAKVVRCVLGKACKTEWLDEMYERSTDGRQTRRWDGRLA